MPILPRGEDVRSIPAPRASRPIAQFNGQGIGQGLKSLSAGVEAVGRGLDRADSVQHTIDVRRKAEDEQRDRFETNRRFLEFAALRESDVTKLQQNAKPGAFGLSDEARKNYKASADKFMHTIPEHLRDQYDAKLFALDDRIYNKAYNFERGVRKNYYNERVTEGLNLLEKNLFENPKSIKENFEEGRSYISALPDDDVSPIEKQQLIKAWKVKAQVASLGGMTPTERLNAIGRGAGTVKFSGNIKRQTGVRQIVAAEAAAVGVPAAIALGIVSIESNFKSNAKAKTSSASGLYQLIKGTASQYGLSDPFKPKDNANAGARLMRDNINSLKSAFPGREPSPGEIYLAHFSGVGTAKQLMKVSANTPTSSVFSAAAIKANRSILQGKTTGEVIAWANRKMASHMRDAGVEVEETPPNQAQPEFADLPLNVVQKIERGAFAELDDESRRVDRIAKTEQAAEKARLSAYSENVGLRIEVGELTSQKAILDDPNLDDGEKAKHIGSLKSAQKKSNEVLADVQALGKGKLSLNSYDKTDQTRAKKMYDFLRKNLPEGEDVSSFNEAFVRGAGTVPSQIISELRAAVESNDPQAVGDGLVRAKRIQAATDTGFRGISSAGSLVKRIEQYDAFLSRGLSAENATKQVVKVNDPEAIKSHNELMKAKETKDWLKSEASVSVIGDMYDTGVMSFDANVGRMDRETSAVVGEYRQMLEDGLRETGSYDDAKVLAEQRFKRIYGETSVGLKSGVVRLPIEKTYPLVDGSHDYITNQAKSALVEAGFKADGVMFQADEATEADMKAGRPPRYRVFFREADGVLQLYQGHFVGDLKDAKENSTSSRKQKFDEKRAVSKADRALIEKADKAYEETVGPEWMKVKAREAIMMRGAE